MRDRILSKLGMATPIVQAPMAGASTAAMAAAVSNSGGLGFLGIGAITAAAAASLIQLTRTLTYRAFGVNLFCHQPAIADAARETEWRRWLAPEFARFSAQPPDVLREIYTSFVVARDMLDMLVHERPAVVSFHFGLPSSEVITMLKRSNIVLMATATSLVEARQIERAGIDIVVAQGVEAGGHRGVFDTQAIDQELATLVLTRDLVKDCHLPVIAAGGIMDGAGIAAALASGACAAQLGTAYLACPESAIDEGYRHALMNGNGATVFTASISGRKARCLVNAFTRLDLREDRPEPPSYPIAYDAGKALHAAARAQGEHGYGAHWAGQRAALARSMPAALLTETLYAEYRAAARGGSMASA